MSARLATLVAVFTSLPLVGCPSETPVIDLGTLTVSLWAPEDDDYLADAESVTVTTTVDDETATRTFGPGEPLRLTDLAGAPEGSTVSVVVETDGTSLPDAIARTNNVTLSPEGGAQSTAALLSARDAARRFSEVLPDNRADAALCSDDEGTILVTGGTRAGALATGSVVFDPRERALVPGPGQTLPARGGACAILDDDSVVLLAGAGLDGTGPARLYAAPSVRDASPFVESAISLVATKRGLGATLAVHGDSLWLLYDDVLERRLLDDLSDVTRTTLAESHLFGSLAVDDEGALVSGGFSDIGETLPSASAERVSRTGERSTVPSLAGSVVASFGGRVFALVDDAVYRLTAPTYTLASAVLVRSVGAVTPSAYGRTFIALDDDVTAFVGDDGAVVKVVRQNAVGEFPLTTAHPSGALVRGLSGGLFVVGGAAGSSVVVVE